MHAVIPVDGDLCALQAGFDLFITKPLRVVELEAALERLAALG
jgi:CheY-like chemotaxis protein